MARKPIQKKPDRYGALSEVSEKIDWSKKNKRPGPKTPLEDRRLTRKQELFVRELVTKDGQITLTEAAINAGYAPRSAAVRASEMTNPRHSPHVVKAIRDYRAELDQKYGVEYKRHLRDLQRIRDEALAAGAFSAAVQAEYRRGQAHGDIYVSKSEVRHGTIDSMSKDDVLKALQELKKNYAPITTDTGIDSTASRTKTRERLLADVQETDDNLSPELDSDET